MKNRNVSVDLFRFLAALSIMFLHTCWGLDDSLLNAYPIIGIVIGRYPVILFFTISGYYCFLQISKGRNAAKTQIRSLLKVYCVWTVVYYLMSFVLNVAAGHEPVGKFFAERVLYFFTEGSYPHLWYVVSLIYVMILICLVYELCGEQGIRILAAVSMILFMIGVLGTSYLPLGEQIPVLGDFYGWKYYFVFRNIFCLGLPGVMFGYYIVRLLPVIEKRPKLAETGFFITSVLGMIEGMIVIQKGWISDFPSMFLMPFVLIFGMSCLIRHPLGQLESHAVFLKRMSSYIYFVHPAVIAVLGFLLQVTGAPFLLDGLYHCCGAGVMLRNHFDEDKKTVDKAVYLEESGEKEDEKSDQDLGRSAVCRCFIRGNSRMYQRHEGKKGVLSVSV